MSANISFPRAAVSCLPLVGTFVGIYNTIETKNQFKSLRSPLLRSQDKMQSAIIQLQDSPSALGGSQEAIQATKELAQEFKAEREQRKQKLIEVLEKRAFYSKCGLVSNILSIAGVVVLFALGFFTTPGTILMLAAFSLNVGIHARNLYEVNQILTKPRPDLSQQPRRADALDARQRV